jgi:hypothetical protein
VVPPAVQVSRPLVGLGGEPTEGTMPSLVGVAEADARQAVFLLGVTEEELTVTEVPAAGQSGLVIRQEPAPGQGVEDGVVLEISAPATVPAVVGRPESEARAELADLGARVVVESRYDPAATEGTVLEVAPAAGAPLVDGVTLTVAAASSSVFATQITAVEDGCYAESATVAARLYTEALTCGVSSGADDPTVQEWVLNREVTSLDFTLGQDDFGTTGFRVTVRVLVDGQVVTEAGADHGTTTPVSVPVAGALRVRVELRSSAVECCETVSAVLGEPRFIGSPAAIDALVEASGG